MKEVFRPRLADRECRRCAAMTFRIHPDGGEMNGADVMRRLDEIGVMSHADDLLAVAVGGVVKTGFSAYERIA